MAFHPWGNVPETRSGIGHDGAGATITIVGLAGLFIYPFCQDQPMRG